MAKKAQDVRPIIKLRSTAGTGYTVGTPGAASGTITDNDVTPPAVVMVVLTGRLPA